MESFLVILGELSYGLVGLDCSIDQPFLWWYKIIEILPHSDNRHGPLGCTDQGITSSSDAQVYVFDTYGIVFGTNGVSTGVQGPNQRRNVVTTIEFIKVYASDR